MPTIFVAMSSLSNTPAAIAGKLRDLLFPPSCAFCNQPLPNDEVVCRDCVASLSPLAQPRCCPRCALPLPEGALPGICGHCLASQPAHQRAVSLFAYRDAVRQSILHWKLHGDDRAIIWLIDAAADTLRRTIRSDDLLLPIPMPLVRMRTTGQHHAANLCRTIAATTGCQWEWRWLKRRGNQPRQSSLSRQQRRANLKSAFTLNNSHRPQLTDGATLWLVDDIMTTGATLHYAARTLAKQGIPCAAFTLARTLPK
ncbi:MAG: ComF family protein [Mariprofundales bacterium]